MGLFNKILKKEKTVSSYDEMSQQEKLSYILKIEKEHDDKMYSQGKPYYFSEEAKITGKKVSGLKKDYVKSFPEDFLTTGADLFQILWYYVPGHPDSEKEIFTLTGKGKYYEDLGEYEKAIECYQEADDLTMTVCGDEIQELIDECGPGDYLYTRKIRQRIRVCEKRLLKEKTDKLELEAKSLEKTNPVGAIELYQELNRLKPGLKKYNKRIEICKKKL